MCMKPSSSIPTQVHNWMALEWFGCQWWCGAVHVIKVDCHWIMSGPFCKNVTSFKNTTIVIVSIWCGVTSQKPVRPVMHSLVLSVYLHQNRHSVDFLPALVNSQLLPCVEMSILGLVKNLSWGTFALGSLCDVPFCEVPSFAFPSCRLMNRFNKLRMCDTAVPHLIYAPV